MKVADCMSRNICVLSLDNSLQSAAQLMAEMDSGFLPVADKDELIGIVTDRDIAIRGVGMGLAPSAGVEEAMSDEVRYCFAEDEVEKVLHTMGTLQVRRLPVLDRDKRLGRRGVAQRPRDERRGACGGRGARRYRAAQRTPFAAPVRRRGSVRTSARRPRLPPPVPDI